jgi:hypothetical protein
MPNDSARSSFGALTSMDYEALLDWFRSMMNEMDPDKGGSTKKNKVKVRKRRPPARASRSHRAHSRKRESRRGG